MTWRYLIVLTWVIFLVGCSPSSEQAATLINGVSTHTPAYKITSQPIFTPAPTKPSVATKMSTPTFTPTPAFTTTPYPTPDLSQRPQIWFAPLPPLKVVEGRPFTGAEDFMELFDPQAAWTQAADYIHVFKLYGEWVGDDPWTIHASNADLRRVIAELNRRGIALAMEAGPLNATSVCGEGIEGFGGGVRIGIRDAQRIKDAGGTLTYIALDEPFAFASLYQGHNACGWPAERVAREVGAYIQGVRTVFPSLLVGDTEPLWWDVDVEDYKVWLSTFREVNGYDLAFFHLDLDFGRADWAQAALALETFTRGMGVDFGIIYTGNPNAPDDESWLTAAGERVKQYELVAGGKPDHVLFQSWHDHPDRTLPEAEPYTFTWFINAYRDDKASLGVRTVGLGANVAYGKPVRASRSNQARPEGAVDGNPDTYWGAGDFAPQWIEIDLGAAFVLGEVRLLTSQSPTGETTHRVRVKGPNAAEAFSEVHTFSGVTVDAQWLTIAFPELLKDIRYVRIETLSSPSWVAWREIEVIAAE